MQTNLNLAIKIDNNGTYKILSCVMRFFEWKRPKLPPEMEIAPKNTMIKSRILRAFYGILHFIAQKGFVWM